MNKIKLATVLLLSLLIVSCNKSEDVATGVGDVIIFAKKSGSETVYGLLIYAYTFSEFENVKVTLASDPNSSYTLKSNQGFKTTFFYETPTTAMTGNKPAAGTYNFTASFVNGATDEFQDILTDKVLAVPTISKSDYSLTKGMLEVEWAPLTDATTYSIQILDGTTQVFASTELGNAVKAYSISANGGGWAAGFTPESGKSYTLRLFAYLYEENGNSYNLQSSAMAEKSITWGSGF